MNNNDEKKLRKSGMKKNNKIACGVVNQANTDFVKSNK